MADKPALVKPIEEVVPIAKPSAFDLEKFKSKRAAAAANGETLQTGLPHHSISQANDFVRLHADEENYWSPELCFVNVPIKGQNRDTLHLIEEDLAMQYLPGGSIHRCRLALATKPYDVFFLCHVPSQNLDNKWNEDNLTACEKAKTWWAKAVSRRPEGADGYHVTLAREQDFIPDPKWPPQSLGELIGLTFAGCLIDRADHPALLRLIGAKQNLS